MKVLFVNNYPMDEAWEQWKNREYPGHFLWGATQLHEYGIEIEILPYEKFKGLKQLSDRIKVLGDLDQQFRMLLHSSDYDLIYSASDVSTLLLGFLRSIGIFRKPIVAMMHRPYNTKLISAIFVRLFIKPHDRLICLSTKIRDGLSTKFGISENKMCVVEWGVDLPFYDDANSETSPLQASESPFFISAGKTERDYKTLIKAFAETNYALKIYGVEPNHLPVSILPANVTLPRANHSDVFIPYDALLREYRRAYAIVLPLDLPTERANTTSLIGLTSLLEAMAVGKAVIMTRNPIIDIDIEKEGIGIFVEFGDVEGWRKAIAYLASHPETAKQMGYRARQLCEEKYRLERFTAQVAGCLKDTVHR